jgi:transposase
MSRSSSRSRSRKLSGSNSETRATLAKYGVTIEGASDAFGKRERQELDAKLTLLPPHSRFALERVLEQLDTVQDQIERFEYKMKKLFRGSRVLELLQTLPGVGFILAIVILPEVGEVSRFPAASLFGLLLGHDSQGRCVGRQNPLRSVAP